MDRKKKPQAAARRAPAQKKAEEAASSFASGAAFKGDPGGSYTGRAAEPNERPVQDSDDL